MIPKEETAVSHGPDNAEPELRRAYNAVIEASTMMLWERGEIPGTRREDLTEIYKHAFKAYRRGDRLAAERWARSAKHLARALWHEAKIAYLEPRTSELPYLEGATPEEYDLHQRSDTTQDLLDSVANHVPTGLDETPETMKRFLGRARKHLEILEKPDQKHELLRAERIKAAYEYGRLLECMALAYEAETGKKAA